MKPYPLLCTITQEPGQGGIAGVSRLMWYVLQEASGNRCKRIQLFRKGSRRATLVDKLIFIKEVTYECAQNNVDWIIFDHLGLARFQMLIPGRIRRPYAVFLHSFEAWSPLSIGRKRVLRRASVRIANSHYTAARIKTANPDIGPIQVCHLALLPPKAELQGSANVNSSLDRSVGHSMNPAVLGRNIDASGSQLDSVGVNSVLIVGRMPKTERHKGHDYLIDAWPIVKNEVADAQLVIVGSGDDVARLQAKAESTGLGESILFLGQVEDDVLQRVYQTAALFAMPSNGEGFGLVYLEAMRNHLPCIGSPHDAAAEIIQDGVTGFLIDQKDVPALARGIVTLLQDPSRRRDMGQLGFERLQKLFSLQQFQKTFLGILENNFQLR